jgi:tetratricopeptide (TPR) repeat protein
MRLPLIGLMGFFCATLCAQDFKRQYQSARLHFDEGRYALAFEGFKPLLVYDKNNPYPVYANFFYALSAYRLGYRALAKETLKQLTQLYPDWPSGDEARLWQAKLAFEDGDVFRALAIVGALRDEVVRSHAHRMVRYELARVEDAETLRMLLEENPDNRLVAEAAVYRSIKNFVPTDKIYIDSVIHAHALDTAHFKVAIPAAAKKERYVVSLLFPFLAPALQPTPQPKPNQAVLHLYHGIRLAADSLAKRGVAIDLRAYDTERNPEKLKALLQTGELKNSDLLVGPLFPDEVSVVRDFSAAHRINMINPVTHNSDFAAGNPYALLFQPSHETIGRKAAAWVAANVRNRNALVYFGDAVRDSVLAFSFMREALKAGLNIRLARQVRRETAHQIVATLATPTEFDEFKNPVQFTLKRDSIGAIFVASDDPLIYTKVVNSVQTRHDSTVVVGGESWIASESNAISLENFERLGIVLWAPNHTGLHTPAYQSFVRRYMKKHGVFPSANARIGFEFMLAVGDILHRHGAYFQAGLEHEGIFTGPFDRPLAWGEAFDNQQVPFIRVSEGMLTPAGTRGNR